ncbi:low molecular weight phosphatase family protein [Halobacteriales archaeon QS_4_62_28]|nr:MAG: low molecular weight phosphatase family protein [Halobacteriales archaeon QS_4_62_28]
MAQTSTIRLDFLCVQNAGRSQMAAAFAERERDERGLDDLVEIHSGGTDPADQIHEEVAAAMSEIGIDLSDRKPRYVVLENLKDSHFLITMGCSISQFNPARYGVEHQAWDLTNPDGKEMETVREVRDEIEQRVQRLFDEIEQTANERTVQKSLSQRVTSAIRDTISF